MSDDDAPNPIERFFMRDDLRSDDDPLPAWPVWPTTELCGGRRRLRPLREDPEEWGRFAAMWAEAYPEIKGSPTGRVLDPSIYPEMFGAGRDWLRREHYAVVIEDLDDDTIFGGATYLLEPSERSAQAVLFSILPDYRGSVMTARCLFNLFDTFDVFVEESGVDYAWCMATAKHRLTQDLFLRQGWTIRGVMPGMHRSYAGLGMHRRDTFILMDKLYNRGPEIMSKTLELSPEAERVLAAQTEGRPPARGRGRLIERVRAARETPK